MVNLKKVMLAAFTASIISACSYVPPGNVGIMVNTLGGDKGVDAQQLPVGRYYVGWYSTLYNFPVFMQNYTWTKQSTRNGGLDESISFQTADGLTANADMGISYQIEPDKVATVFQTYRRGIDEITDTFLHNMVRDALVKEASSKPIEYVYGAGKAELISSVQRDVSNQVEPIGIKIDKVYWIGEIRLPDQVLQSINAKNAAIQNAAKVENEVQQSKAQAQKDVAESEGRAASIRNIADAQAYANQKVQQSLTPELVQYKAIEKWNGVLPQMTGGNAIPLINIQSPADTTPKQ